MRIVGNDVTVDASVPNVLMAMGLGATMTRSQLQTPTLLRMWPNEFVPINAAALPASPHKQLYHDMDPIPLAATEPLDALIQGTSGGSENDLVVAELCDGPITPVTGDIRTIRATGTTTLVANAWTNVALTFANQLPAGTYACVGARARSTNMQAFRIFFVNQWARPGGIGVNAVGDITSLKQRMGYLGTWGQFTHVTPPTIDCLANAADTAETFELDLIKIA
jgi:hypothetical protein